MRREIRQLNDKDRVAFFDAMEKLYRLPTSEGRRIYGDDYKVCARAPFPPGEHSRGRRVLHFFFLNVLLLQAENLLRK